MMEHFPVKTVHAVRRATWEGWKIPERRIWNYELVLLLKGQGCITIRDEQFDVHAGDLIVFYPGVRHSLWVTEEPYMEFIGVHFELPEGTQMLPVPELMHLEKGNRLEPLFKEVQETHAQKTYQHTWRTNVLIEQILCEICILLQQRRAPADVQRIARALEYIHAAPSRNISLEELLAHTGMKKTQFLQAFRGETGTTPKQYTLALRLEQARDLLLETAMPVAEIAERCGFDDAFYFSRSFRQRFSVSPRAYRKRHL